jgi:hypothetical protein
MVSWEISKLTEVAGEIQYGEDGLEVRTIL